jgi:flavin-dependent dehydrogenase
VLGFSPENAVVNELKEIEIFSPNRCVKVSLRQPDLVVERAAIIRLLARKAIEAGVEIRSKSKLVHLEPAAAGVKVTVRDGHRNRLEQFETRTLIGADGAFSRVAKFAERNSHPTVPILQGIVNVPAGKRTDTAQVWFEPEDTPYFYWLIPESPTRAAVGFISEEGKNAKMRLGRFLSRLGLQAVEMQSARIPAYAHLTRPWRRLAGADIYLVGDAAAQVKVTTVGGLVTGLRGSRAAVNAILHGAHYLRELRPLRRELSLHLMIRTLLNGFRGVDYDRLLDSLNQKTVRLLGRYDRDQASYLLCRILLAQPGLLRFASKLLGGIWRN